MGFFVGGERFGRRKAWQVGIGLMGVGENQGSKKWEESWGLGWDWSWLGWIAGVLLQKLHRSFDYVGISRSEIPASLRMTMLR